MSEPSLLESLVFEYEARRRAGRPCTPEDLVALVGRPELLEPLRCRLGNLDSLMAFLGGALPPAAETPAPGVADSSPDPAPVTERFERSRSDGLPAFLGPPSGGPLLLGGYRVTGVLGQGGMGVVLRAEDPALERCVAVKVMRPEVAALPAARQRFLREARAAAQLSHPNVVAVHHVGEQGGVPFLVMPLLEGESLAARLGREGRLLVAEAARVAREAALGLAAAHEKGLAHRDVKPANLWLEGPEGRVKVLDFGLARRGQDAALTGTGAVLGTPLYMSPEQARGGETGPPSDVFSLGCVLYQALAGAAPFRGDDTLSLLNAVATEEPPPLRQARPEVPAGLEAVCLACLSKSPAGRPTAAELAARLGAFVDAGASQAVTADLPPPPPRRTRRLRALLGAALVLLPLLALGVWLATRPGSVPESPRAAPIRGSVDLLVYRVKDDGSDVLVPLSHPLAMPLRTGDHFKVVAEVDRPAYLYLFWVDENGIAAPMYPWTPGEWGTRPADERPVPKLDLVAPNGKGFTISGDADGMETIVMLARSERLPAGDAEVRGWFAGLKPLPFRGPQARVWFENFDVVRDDEKRAFTIADVAAVDGPRGLQLALKQKVGAVELARAISFARVGPKR